MMKAIKSLVIAMTVVAYSAAATAQTTEPAQAQEQKSFFARHKVAIFVASAVVAAAGIAGGLYAFAGKPTFSQELASAVAKKDAAGFAGPAFKALADANEARIGAALQERAAERAADQFARQHVARVAAAAAAERAAARLAEVEAFIEFHTKERERNWF